MSPEKVDAIKKKMAEEREGIRRQLETAATGEVFKRTNSVDNPKPHPPRAGELARGFPDNPYRKQ